MSDFMSDEEEGNARGMAKGIGSLVLPGSSNLSPMQKAIAENQSLRAELLQLRAMMGSKEPGKPWVTLDLLESLGPRFRRTLIRWRSGLTSTRSPQAHVLSPYTPAHPWYS